MYGARCGGKHSGLVEPPVVFRHFGALVPVSTPVLAQTWQTRAGTFVRRSRWSPMMKFLSMSKLNILLIASSLQVFTGCAIASTENPARWTPPVISSDQYESSAVFASMGQEMYFMRADRKFGSYLILRSKCVNGKWQPPVELHLSTVDGSDNADPFVTRDGTKLYFISTRHRYSEVGNEDFDILVSERNADGEWGEPVRLPEPVNSTGSELFPRLDSDGILYFGSDRPGGVGGTDIYSARQARDGSWQVVNVRSLNTTSNEYEAAISDDGTKMAVISDREGKSRLHIFTLDGDQWIHKKRLRARESVFQVGPLWSPDGKRLMFSQDTGEDSGEIFVVNTKADPDPSWPPTCQPSYSQK